MIEVHDIGGYPFRRVCRIDPIRNSNGAVRCFIPHSLYKNIKGLLLHGYGAGPFCEFKIPRARPPSSGVYAIFAISQMKYIGKCGPRGLYKRFSEYGKIRPRNCFKPDGPRTTCRINNLIYLEALKNNPIYLWFFATSECGEIEDKLIALFRPPWNLR